MQVFNPLRPCGGQLRSGGPPGLQYARGNYGYIRCWFGSAHGICQQEQKILNITE